MDEDIEMTAQVNGEVAEREEEGGDIVLEHHQNGVAVMPPLETEGRDLDGNNITAMAEEGSSSSAVNQPVIYNSVRGFDMRSNDCIYAPPLVVEEKKIPEAPRTPGPDDPDYDPFADEDEIIIPTNSNKVIVFFGGDIQDIEEMMRTNGEYKNYVEWNLENIARILQRQFPTHHIVVVRPVRMQVYMFSCFDNFVPCNTNTGHPEHTPNNFAIQHMELLLKSLSSLIEENAKATMKAREAHHGGSEEEAVVSSTTTEDSTGTNDEDQNKISHDLNPHLERANISLVGFSKGCVVLNQLIYEFHYIKTLTPDDRSMEGFLRSIKHMHWLDGGHNGGKNTWITSRSLLETLTRTGIHLHVHMSPYQLNDTRRPYIRREEKAFTDILTRLGAFISRHVHFEKDTPSLDIHFQLIAQFSMCKTSEQEDNKNDCDDEDQDIPHVSLLPMSSDYES